MHIKLNQEDVVLNKFKMPRAINSVNTLADTTFTQYWSRSFICRSWRLQQTSDSTILVVFCLSMFVACLYWPGCLYFERFNYDSLHQSLLQDSHSRNFLLQSHHCGLGSNSGFSSYDHRKLSVSSTHY